MCKYCEGLKINPHTFNGEQEALYEDQDLIVQVAQDTPIGRRAGYSSLDFLLGAEEKHIKIFYCPMCGRKLNTIDEPGSEIKEKIKKSAREYATEHGGQLQAIKYFIDRLINVGENTEDEIKEKMKYIGVGRLKFVKDMHDSDRLDELDELLKEYEGI